MCTTKKLCKRRLLLTALCCLAMKVCSGADPGLLTAMYPVPNEALTASVINTEFPQQARIAAISRVAEQTTEDDDRERAEWLFSLFLHPDAQNAVKSHALDQLFFLEHKPANIFAEMLASVTQPAADPEWQEIGLLCLTAWYPRFAASEQTTFANHLAALAVSSNAAAVKNAASSAAALNSVSPAFSQIARTAFERIFSEFSDQPEAVIAGIQAVSRTQSIEFLDYVRVAATSPSALLRVRMSAVACLGEMGAPEDAAVITAAGSGSRWLRTVSRHALETLRGRFPEIY